MLISVGLLFLFITPYSVATPYGALFYAHPIDL